MGRGTTAVGSVATRRTVFHVAGRGVGVLRPVAAPSPPSGFTEHANHTTTAQGSTSAHLPHMGTRPGMGDLTAQGRSRDAHDQNTLPRSNAALPSRLLSAFPVSWPKLDRGNEPRDQGSAMDIALLSIASVLEVIALFAILRVASRVRARKRAALAEEVAASRGGRRAPKAPRPHGSCPHGTAVSPRLAAPPACGPDAKGYAFFHGTLRMR